MAKHFGRKRRSILGRLVGLLLFVMVVCSIVFGVSAYGIYQLHAKADAALDNCEAHLKNFEISAAHADAKEAAGYFDEINREFEGVQWQVARNLPYLGHDVQIVIDSADIARDLVSDAFLPVLDGASGLTSGLGGLDILGTIAAAPGAVGAIKAATEVVRDCDARAQALPEPYLPILSDVTKELREQTGQSAELLKTAESALGAADVVKGLLT
jgi:hypothetical protein